MSDEKKKFSETGFEIKEFYTPADIKGFDYSEQSGDPGEYPFTRHVYPTGYRDRTWVMRLYAGFGTAEDTNERWKFLLEQGNMGVSCAFDLPTQLGLDSDNQKAEAEVGRLGVAIDTLRDFEILFDGIPLDKVTVSLNINAPLCVIFAMLLGVAEKQGVSPEKLTGTLSNDNLMEYIARGMWVFPPSFSLKLTADVAEYSAKNVPGFYPFNVRGILLHEAGADPAHEIGITFSIACKYMDSVLERDINIDDFAHRISFFFAEGLHIFEEAAKYRAARRLWARIMKEKYKARMKKSMLLRFTSTVGGSWYRAVDPELNLVRGAYGALGAVLGGTQAMLMPALDEPFSIPTEETARLALRIQQILADETDVTYSVDPLAGSYFVEYLTDKIEEEIKAVMEKIESLGGIIKGIETGAIKSWLETRAYRVKREEDEGKRVVVGVNKYHGDMRKIQIHKHNPEIAKRQIERLNKVRQNRDEGSVKRKLEVLTEAARDDENLIPYIMDAVKVYATLGEITSVLKSAFGEFKEPT
jgi:methylmalonyl-CoA mutase N-terminal domain/subunit